GEGHIYIAGASRTPGWTEGGFNTTLRGSLDGLVMKLSPAGVPLWSSYLGGFQGEVGVGIALDSAGNPYISGSTSSPDWSDETAESAPDDAFVVRMTRTGGFVWMQRLGGDKTDVGWNLALDPADNVLVCGRTASEGWTESGEFGGGTDAY